MSKESIAKARALKIKQFGHLYTFEDYGDRLTCAYCGDVREHVDHIPPISLLRSEEITDMKERGIEFITVPACALCNVALGNKPLWTFEDRVLFLYERLLTKADGAVFWSDEEINESLSGQLKREVISQQAALRRDLIDRLRGLENRLCNLEPRFSPKTPKWL